MLINDKRLLELRTLDLPRLTFTDVFAINAGELGEADRNTITSYLQGFTLVKHESGQACPCCGELLAAGDSITGLIMGATFHWSLTHGEGYCRSCNYPARAYHFNVGPVERFVAILPYHPSSLTTKAERRAMDAAAVDAARGELETDDLGRSSRLTRGGGLL